MSSYPPATIHAAFMPSPDQHAKAHKRPKMSTENIVNVDVSSSVDRDIQVSAIAEVTAEPDQYYLRMAVMSKKETASDAKNSVTRRVDYILQTLRNHNIKDEDVKQYQNLQRDDAAYVMTVELKVNFTAIDKCQSVSNFLVEKLDPSVKISGPEMTLTQQGIENLRRQASLLAIHNAKEKATEMTRYLNQVIGKPLKIHEVETKEWTGKGNDTFDSSFPSLQDQVTTKSLTVRTKVFVIFELKVKPKMKQSGSETLL